MKIQLVAAICALLAGQCNLSHAADWQQFSLSKDGAKGYTDYERIKRDQHGSHTYRAWWRTVLAKPAPANGKTFVLHISLHRVDCDKLTVTSLAAHYYDSKGKVVLSEEWESATSVAIPDSTGETFVNAICSAAKIRGL